MRVLLGMSGGLDSTLAVKALRDAGYTVEGAVLKMHGYTEIDAARESAAAMGVPLHIVDCGARFSECVVRNFTEEYEAGRTPNPCIICNPEVKFRGLLETADKLGIAYIATGHYARVCQCGTRYAIAPGADREKDQSYMLYRLEQSVLKRLLLPLADAQKAVLRAQADALKLSVADRPESQEICFIQGESYRDFLERVCGPATPGNFVDEEGRVLGTHRGIRHYTVGQRKGLGISAASRLFVRRILPEENEILLSASVFSGQTEFYLRDVCFQGAEAVEEGRVYSAMLRYRAPMVDACVEKTEAGWRVRLASPVRAVTPGQSAVFYKDGCVAFGGIISEK